MKEIEESGIKALTEPLPAWAIKPHPKRKNMSAIHPMAIIDRLNSVFGFGKWHFSVEYISCDKEIELVNVYEDGKPTGAKRERQIYVSAVKGTLDIPDYDIHIEQFGGSDNDDKGDSLKGGGTDALTKVASYLGIGAEIYKGHGNVAPGQQPQQSTNVRR